MNRTNYSQNNEQQAILEFFGDFKGRFLDVGAFDGKTLSNTYALLEDGWVGVMVEGSPLLIERLLANTASFASVRIVNAVIGVNRLLRNFWLDESASSYSSTSVLELAGQSNLKRTIITPCICANDLERFGPFDFVSVDIEGMDRTFVANGGCILESAKLICVEIGHDENRPDARAIRKHLLDQGFTKQIYRSPENVILAKP